MWGARGDGHLWQLRFWFSVQLKQPAEVLPNDVLPLYEVHGLPMGAILTSSAEYAVWNVAFLKRAWDSITLSTVEPKFDSYTGQQFCRATQLILPVEVQRGVLREYGKSSAGLGILAGLLWVVCAAFRVP